MIDLTRRGFLGAILVAGAAPAIVRAESLMKVVGFGVEPKQLILPPSLTSQIITDAGVSAELALGRLFTVRTHSRAAIECDLEGLPVVRRYVDYSGAEMTSYALERIEPRSYRKLVL